MAILLKLGSRGTEVATLQKLLTERGFPVDVDGIFGEETYKAVIAFQSGNLDQEGLPLEGDGEVGEKTWWCLNHPQSPGTLTTLTGRSIYIWKLAPVLAVEMGIDTFVLKAKKAHFSSVWIKIAEGAAKYENLTGEMEQEFVRACTKLADEGITVWGWHVPYCRTAQDAELEATLVSQIAHDYNLSGILIDAESESTFFKGTPETAEIYGAGLRNLLAADGKGLAISSHDIPGNFPGFPFDSFAKHATVNAPQVYYGSSSSVENRLNRAVDANSYLNMPFVPVGAGWLGDGGGCCSASDCAERAVTFIRLARERGFPGYSFWHWQGAPSKLWETFFRESI